MKLHGTNKCRVFASMITMILFAGLALPIVSSAQEQKEQKKKHHHYKLIDLGTFGGPGGGISNTSSPTLNGSGALVGISDTSKTDPFSPDCFLDCFLDHGWVWRNGVLTELKSLPGGASNFPVSINDNGQITGESQNGAIDPLTGWPQADAVIWQGRKITKLGTLGGNQSTANANNISGQVVGAALTTTIDPFASTPLCSTCGTFAQTYLFAPAATEMHAFRWVPGQGMQDLGTLGGPDSNAWITNDRGQVAGESFTSFTPDPSTGVPPIHPFLWEKGKGMTDLGSLGGIYGEATWLNNRGQVVGFSTLADGNNHAIRWDEDEGLKDLGVLPGGAFSSATWINDAGEVVGFSDASNGLRPFLWKNGAMIDLGTVANDACSLAASINSQGQIVGFGRADCFNEDHAFLWENGGPLVDLNTLVLPGTTMFVDAALVINDGGEIGCLGSNPTDTVAHACVLIPCDENHAGVEDCDFDTVNPEVAVQVRPAQITQPSAASSFSKLSPAEKMTRFRSMMAGRDRRFKTPQTSPK
jgi:probable HAF family extracellular repeat protein